jgi:3-dehydroquinate dehydratase type I
MEPIASLTPETADDPLAALAAPPTGTAVVEIRADLLPELDLSAAVAASAAPCLVTFRSTAEGGRGPDDPATRRRLLETARNSGAALIDVEYRRDLEAVDALGLAPEQTVLSWHDPAGTPDDLWDVVSSMLSRAARIIKVVPTANGLSDVARVLEQFDRRRTDRERLTCFAMGAVGMASRFLGPLLGSPLTFAAWTDRSPAAPGQVSVARLLGTVGHLNGPPQRLFGVVGSDVANSASPEMYGAAYREAGLPYALIPVSVPDSRELAELFAPAGDTLFDRAGTAAHGWAVTTPYKRAAFEAATVAAPRAARARAANTLILKPDGLLADNTDADGVVASLVSIGIDPLGRSAAIQGTGGAARGAAVGLDLAGAEVSLRGRDSDHTRETAERLGVRWLGPDEEAPARSILVNATPLGRSTDDPLPLRGGEISAAAAVIDMVYGPHRPALEDAAADAGVPYLAGRTVLAHQGYAQFAAFTGRLPPKAAMLAALGIGNEGRRTKD